VLILALLYNTIEDKTSRPDGRTHKRQDMNPLLRHTLLHFGVQTPKTFFRFLEKKSNIQFYQYLSVRRIFPYGQTDGQTWWGQNSCVLKHEIIALNPCTLMTEILALNPCTFMHETVALNPFTLTHEIIALNPCTLMHEIVALNQCTLMHEIIALNPCTLMHEILALNPISTLRKRVQDAACCWFPLRTKNFWPVARTILISSKPVRG
jgi:hypothetical protein